MVKRKKKERCPKRCQDAEILSKGLKSLKSVCVK